MIIIIPKVKNSFYTIKKLGRIAKNQSEALPYEIIVIAINGIFGDNCNIIIDHMLRYFIIIVGMILS